MIFESCAIQILIPLIINNIKDLKYFAQALQMHEKGMHCMVNCPSFSVGLHFACSARVDDQLFAVP